MKNLILLTSSNINGLNGAAKFCKWMSYGEKFFFEKGINFILISNSSDFSNGEEYTKTYKHKFKQLIKSILNKTSYGKRIAFFNYYIQQLASNIIRKFEQITTNNEDLYIIINDIFVAGEFYRKYKNKYKTIFMMHNSGELLSMLNEEMKDSRIRSYLKQTESDIYKYANRIVFVSDYSKYIFCKIHNDLKEKAETVYNGIPMDEFSIDDRSYDKLRLITVGTICQRKNQIGVIHAIKELNNNNIQITIVGDGPDYKKCERYIVDNNLNDRIILTGAQDNVLQYLEKANAFIMASFDEGLPIAAQEAMGCSLPLILTDVGGCRDLIKGNGILIKPTNDDIKKAILYYVNHVNELQIEGKISRDIFESKFTIDCMYNGYIDIINRL